ncbi:uncharacterized protein K452DRAFT_312035 [Aplosporella prunicola CBS 121167]|uniref:Uncharacterized protein n=1 Tax=Aplosporella prunicola CBS 121167 TaxID=1176127 RepID=A0A6A6B3R3_9PEZI|nr:uncharacterized protein K452DRAFT_312035 [Aplosporella prunicola CBS 121167]KAF2137905.1 hypothetical protein K452DRAFT_312035 [Aplosporella prunicola CBS 121167]
MLRRPEICRAARSSSLHLSTKPLQTRRTTLRLTTFGASSQPRRTVWKQTAAKMSARPPNPYMIFPSVFRRATEQPEVRYHRGTTQEFHGLVLLGVAVDILHHYPRDSNVNALRGEIINIGRDMGTSRIGDTNMTMWYVVRDMAELWVHDASEEFTELYLETLLFNTIVRAYDRFLRSPIYTTGHMTAHRVNALGYFRWGCRWNEGVDYLHDLQDQGLQ